MKIQRVFENEFFVVIDKEPMVLTTPAREGEKDPRPCLGLSLQEEMKQQIFPVHRLDFEVSGLVIFAKTAKAHSQANTWFEKKDVLKVYQAFAKASATESVLPPVGEEVLWKCRLLRGKRRSYEHEIGKLSETLAIYRGFDRTNPEWQRFELHPLTGRPHQLRYELYRHGFPIVGDKLYGSDIVFAKPGIALRAVKINFAKTPLADQWGLPSEISVPGFF